MQPATLDTDTPPSGGSPGGAVTAIAAMARNRVIGSNGKIPWKCAADMAHFKRTTMGHTVIMGRKTFESLGKPLSGRRNIVLSRTMAPVPGVEIVPGLTTLPTGEVFIIGGAQVYEEFIPQCGGLHLTVIDQEPPGDTFMPAFEHLFDLMATTPGDGCEFRYYQRRRPVTSLDPFRRQGIAFAAARCLAPAAEFKPYHVVKGDDSRWVLDTDDTWRLTFDGVKFTVSHPNDDKCYALQTWLEVVFP